MTEISRIYTFANGTRIDLHEIICIGAIDKTPFNVIFMPVFCKGFNKPIEITLGHAIGKVDDEKKDKITATYTQFVNAWNLYTLKKKDNE